MGMVNSQSMNQVEVLRSGESVSTSVEALKDPNAKTYYHMVPGARFCMPDGLEVRFLGGQFTTADPAIIAELDKIANKHTSMVYTNKVTVAAITAELNAAAADAAETAGKLTK